jgi:hypothetical protein
MMVPTPSMSTIAPSTNFTTPTELPSMLTNAVRHPDM